MNYVPAAEEMVDIVDTENQVIEVVPRSRMRHEVLRHRSTFILVFDRMGALYVQKRTLTKDIHPGYWDPATGGVVSAGEDYQEAALRELGEELGIRGAELIEHYDLHIETPVNKTWGRVFSCHWDGEIIPQPEEVQFVEKMTPTEVVQRAESENFTPDSLVVVKRWIAMRG